MKKNLNQAPEWVIRGKTIRQLVAELQRFENQDLEVKISTDDGETFKCISLVAKIKEADTPVCGLLNCE